MARILIIEDNLDIRENTVEILELDGHHVMVADNGKIGYEVAVEKHPDLILCDIMMPLMNGMEVLQRLKDNANTVEIPFVFFTANTEKKDVQAGLSLGARAYIEKPFDAAELLAVVRKILGTEK